MNTETAIKVIKDMVEIEWRRHLPDDLEALELAMEALRKQEPMKMNGKDYNCCSCGHNLGFDRPFPNFCPNCGQSIDWED